MLDQAFQDRLVQAIGVDGVTTDAAQCALMSQDIWDKGPATSCAIVAPKDAESLAQAVALISNAGHPLAIRGGGMSYTAGYVPGASTAITLDLSRMDRVLEIDAKNMCVTVEAGCTWKALLDALEPYGLRTPFWGPLSGISSTIGGGISQLNALLGAGLYGTSAESVVGLKIVLADGRILSTGARAPDAKGAFYRHYGPDLTGVFCGDCGVFGIKAEITLRLIQRPSAEAYASFDFADPKAMIEALAEISRQGLASEAFSFDPGLARARMKRASLMSDIATLGSVVAHQTSLLEGVKQAARIALAGRGFLDTESYSTHIVCEGRHASAVNADMDLVRAIAKRHGGKEIENTIPKVIRAQPFTPLNNILGPNGERWVPVHGIVSHDRAYQAFSAIGALFKSLAPEFERHGIEFGFMFTTMSTNGFLIEPVFYWPDSRLPIHDAIVDKSLLAKMKSFGPSPEVSVAVAKARAQVIATFEQFGAAHYQIGRAYPYRASRDEPSRDLLDAIKAALDPSHACNPGGVGFPAPKRSIQ
jgi:FAD/FMN-containing dehydrogenase